MEENLKAISKDDPTTSNENCVLEIINIILSNELSNLINAL